MSPTAAAPDISWRATPTRVALSLGGRTASVRREALQGPTPLACVARAIASALVADEEAVHRLLMGVRFALACGDNPNRDG